MDMGRLKELSEGAEEERGTVAEEAISRQKRTIPGLAGPVAALGAAAAGAVPLCCTSGCCRRCWTSGGRSLRQETWLQGWSSPCSQGKECQAGPRQEAPSKSQARPRLQTSPS